MSKLLKFSLICIVIGVIIFAGIFPYYYFEWGIKSCQGIATDAANCGDADMGGVLFMLYSLPFFALGALGLVYTAVRAIVRRYTSKAPTSVLK
jgi:NADH:ubiquinone oxidoreductase subunit 6 (subunit J)